MVAEALPAPTAQPVGVVTDQSRRTVEEMLIAAGVLPAPAADQPTRPAAELAPLLSGDPRALAYANGAFTAEIHTVEQAPEGRRNGTLYQAACNLGEFVEAGLLDRETVRAALLDAARVNRYVATDGEKAARDTIRSGFATVAGKPRAGVPEGQPTSSKPTGSDGGGYWAPEDVGARPLPTPHQPPPPGGPPDGPGGTPPGGGASEWPEPDDDQVKGHARRHVKWARRYASAYHGRFLYAHGIGWFRYSGRHWVELHDGAEVRALIALIGEVAGRELPKLVGKGHEADRKALLAEIDSVQTANALAGVLTVARNLTALSVPAEDLDHDRFLVNTPSGTLDLRTGALRRSDPLDRQTKITRAGFDPTARSELFDRFLVEIQPDPAMRAFLARSLGSALLGQVRDHVLHIWHGTGANGKGTLRDAMRWTLGAYGVEVPAEILLTSKYGQQALAPERMRLRGARVAFCSEIGEHARLDEAIMKKLTGGDPVNAKLLYRNPIEFEPSHTLIMLTNHLPKVRSDDPATWRRILAVPFDVVVPPDQRDLELPEKLRGAAEAILAWLWQGWLDYQRQGLAPPETVRQATARYQQESDIVARFLSEESGQVIMNMGRTRSAELYRRFTSWAAAEGEDPRLSNKAFTTLVEGHGFKRKQENKGSVWLGLTLATVDEEEPGRWYDQ